MKNGEFPDGARTLRAKIDMASPNIWLRDPILYRIRHAEHHHTGDKWCIYPMYDFAHCLSDYIEGITHSICTLEFEVHRPLYDWILENLDLPRPLPHQYEFARLSLGYTVMSKRKLMQLVNEKLVTGWDDPRMPTISGMRRRGVTPQALRDFAYNIGITKYNSLTDVAVLEHAIREDLNKRALRRLAVLRPIKVVITNFPEGKTRRTRRRQQSRRPKRRQTQDSVQPRTLHRARRLHGSAAAEIFPAQTRRRSALEIRLHHQVRRSGEGRRPATSPNCAAPPTSTARPAARPAGRKVKGTIHWVSAAHAVDAEVRLYDRLFTVPEPDAGRRFQILHQPALLEVVTENSKPTLGEARPNAIFLNALVIFPTN